MTLLALTTVLVYGYTAIPNAPDAVNRLLSSKGQQAPTQKTPEVEYPHSFMDRVVNYKLGHPGVCFKHYWLFSSLYQYIGATKLLKCH